MIEFFRKLFDGSDFPARWHCGEWTAPHGYLHIASDIGIFLAYTAIPLLLLYALRKKKRELVQPVPRLIALFVLFILSCGFTHLNEAIIFYYPFYRFAGVLKAVTAIVSWVTVLALVPALPSLLALKSAGELRREVEEATAALRKEQSATATAEALFEQAVEASPSGMLATDLSGKIVLVNQEAARLFGYEKQELLNRPVEVLVPRDAAERHPHLREEFLARPTARKMGGADALVGRRKDGSTFPLEVGLNPVASPRGDLVLSAIVDRSEIVAQQEQLEEKRAELERSNVELEGFASAASHDLKAPLRAIKNAAQWIEEDLQPGCVTEDIRENIELLKGRAHRMENLLNSLLDYARAGRAASSVTTVQPAEVIDGIVQLLGPEAESAVRVEGELPELFTTRVLFEQVFSNLISNALKHGCRDDLSVVVRGAVEGTDCIYEVSDNGPGIDPEFHERIFQVFQTLRPRDEVEGAGMGLALVKKVVEREGGTVAVRSVPGEGATFVVRWPQSHRMS